MKQHNPVRYLLLYIPFFLALLAYDLPHVSYLIAWSGSILIFYLIYTDKIKTLPRDLKIEEQLMRPIFLMQFVFTTYMSVTSIFYYVNTLGYQYFDYTRNPFVGEETFYAIAKCQRYYVLGHAAMVNGIFVGMKYTQIKYKLYYKSMSNLLLGISLACLPLGYVFGKIGGLTQFSIQLSGLSFVAGTIALAFSIREHKRTNFWFSLALFILNLLASLVSGYKEPIITCILLLGIFLLPVYGKKIIPLFSVLLIAMFLILPTFIAVFRGLANQGVDATVARDKSISAIINSDDGQLSNNNWSFFVYRLSEIDMFIKYVNSTPYYVPYYKASIAIDAITVIVPRFVWPGKPIIEDEVMDRVYRAGVIDELSRVSAKPAYIVDSYLSYGAIGVFIGLFLYGYASQWISNQAEIMFGGYFMGSAVMFAGLFQILWRGNSFEFLVSSVFWSYVTMFLFFRYFKAKNIIEPVE